MNIVSFSGGKDSTAMLLLMLEKNIQIDDIVFCDTGMEFPEMYTHIKKVEKFIKRKITILKEPRGFEYLLGEHKKRNGNIGYGWPDFRNRWCTQLLKKSVIQKYLKQFSNVIEYHGIAVDESHRALKNKENNRKIVYPLITWNLTEQDCLNYCYSKGFNWNGLYKNFQRVSCWCCPLSRIGELIVLYNNYPELWSKLEELDVKSFRKFRSDYSLLELKQKFIKEKE